MTDAQLRNALKAFAVLLVVTQAVITQAITNFVVDLNLTRAQVAVLSLVITGIGVVQLYLPQINKSAGNVRGDSRDD
jgi:hypothetical protein